MSVFLLTFTDHVLHYYDLPEKAVHFFNTDTLMPELKSGCQPCTTRFKILYFQVVNCYPS